MIGKTQMTVDAVFCAAYGPEKHQATRKMWVGGPESDGDATPHATTHDMRAVEVEVLKHPFGMAGIVKPRDPVNPSAGTTGITPVIGDAGKALREMLEEFDMRIDPLCSPLLDVCIKSAWRAHE
jgi:hypothetical protein